MKPRPKSTSSCKVCAASFSSSVTDSTKNTAGGRFLIREFHLCVSAEMEQQQEALRMLQEGNTLLVAKSEQLPAALERLQAELESEKENFESARFAVEQAELARERKKKHLRDGHELYESRLALKIQTSKKDGMNNILLLRVPENDAKERGRFCAALCTMHRLGRVFIPSQLHAAPSNSIKTISLPL